MVYEAFWGQEGVGQRGYISAVRQTVSSPTRTNRAPSVQREPTKVHLDDRGCLNRQLRPARGRRHRLWGPVRVAKRVLRFALPQEGVFHRLV